ncbi:unnamed protein product, partial [Ectocarpus sp. 13 AM-2016]
DKLKLSEKRRVLPGKPRPNEYPKPGKSESTLHKSYRPNRTGFRLLRNDLRLQNITSKTPHSTMVRHVVFRPDTVPFPIDSSPAHEKATMSYAYKPRATNTTVRQSKGKDGDSNTTDLPWWPK